MGRAVQQRDHGNGHALESLQEILPPITQDRGSGERLNEALAGRSVVATQRLRQACTSAENTRTLGVGAGGGHCAVERGDELLVLVALIAHEEGTMRRVGCGPFRYIAAAAQAVSQIDDTGCRPEVPFQ